MISKLPKTSTSVIAVLFTLALLAAASSPALAGGGPRFSEDQVAAGGTAPLAAASALLDRWSWLQSLIGWWDDLFHPGSIAAKACAATGVTTATTGQPGDQSGPDLDPDGCS
jgi:hypothetical protein